MTDVTTALEGVAVDLDDRSLYFNRELSWLQFNARVLELAEDPRIPLLERVKFCAIVSSNLDEFFMVRVAGLHDQIDAGIETPLQDGRTPSATLDAIRRVVRGQPRRVRRGRRRARWGRGHDPRGRGGGAAGLPRRHAHARAPRDRARRGQVRW